MRELKEQVAQALTAAGFNLSAADLQLPPTAQFGQLSLPCFSLAKEWQMVPPEAAQRVAKKIHAVDFTAKAAGPYVNFTFTPAALAAAILPVAGTVPPRGKGTGRVMIEYSQPNTHKEFHIGHLRNVCLGAFLVNLHRIFQYRVRAVNYIGDTGAHVAKCLWNFLKYHVADSLPANKGQYLGEIYAEACERLENEPEAAQEISEIQKKLESGDRKLRKVWRETKDWSMESFYRIYDLLGVKFDHWFWESEEEAAGRKLLKKIIEREIVPEIKMSEGALIADLREYGLEVLVLIKSDGNVLYGAKDLPLGIKKFEKYRAQKSIYVVDKRQELYLKQIFKLLDLFGYADREKIHVAYEFVTLPEGAMASRKGNVVAFENFYAAVYERALRETTARHEDWEPERQAAAAEKISLAAVKFWMLKYDNDSVATFNFDQALALDGTTGPYLLYALARINSLFIKAGGKAPRRIDYAALTEQAEQSLIFKLAQYEEVLGRCLAECAPVKLCMYLVELAKTFSVFYERCPILQAEEKQRAARLHLAEKTAVVLREGLRALNIEPVKEM